EEANAERAGGQDHGQDSAAHGGAGGIIVGESAESDAGETHPGSRFGQSEEQQLVQQGEYREGNGGADRGDLESDVAASHRVDGSAEFADGVSKGRRE